MPIREQKSHLFQFSFTFSYGWNIEWSGHLHYSCNSTIQTLHIDLPHHNFLSDIWREKNYHFIFCWLNIFFFCVKIITIFRRIFFSGFYFIENEMRVSRKKIVDYDCKFLWFFCNTFVVIFFFRSQSWFSAVQYVQVEVKELKII